MSSSQQLGPKRENWMLGDDPSDPSADPFASVLRSRRQKERDRALEAIEAGKSTVQERELNPYLRSGTEPAETTRGAATIVSNSWQRVLVQRSLDRVKRGEASLEAVAAERFGSVEAFSEACQAAGIDLGRYLNRSETRNVPEKLSEEKKSPPVPVEDRNRLMAKKLKAEMKGDHELAGFIQKQLDQLPVESVVSASTTIGAVIKDAPPVDDSAGISQMARHERQQRHSNYDDELAHSITDTKRFGNRMEDLEALSDRFGDRMQPVKRTEEWKAKRKKVSMGHYQRRQRIEEHCGLCQDSRSYRGTLTLAIGNFTYLALPARGQLDALHCCIVPIEHTGSTLQSSDLDSVLTEVRNFKKSLLRMAADLKRPIAFLEAAMGFDKHPHAFVDAVILPAGIRSDPAAYFRKALSECESEWSQHRPIIDTTAADSGGLRRAIPVSFPFLYVDLRLDQGFAHIVEDEARIGPDFLRDLAARLIRLEGGAWRRNETDAKTSWDAFMKYYEPHDWTRILHQE